MNQGFFTNALVVLVVLAALVLAAGRLGWLRGTAPNDLGVTNGQLKAPSRTPNSVSSQASLHPTNPQAARAAVAPLRFSGDGRQAMQRLAALLRRQDGMTIVTEQPEYLRAEARSATLGFVDDVEFWLDPENKVIQMRSASRIGYGDRNVNRKRIEALRKAFAANS